MTLGAKKSRIAIGSLTLSFAAGVALLADEGFTDRAVIPVKGDVPTVAFGMTERPDGSPVQMGDRATPVEGLKRSRAYLANSENRIKTCLTAELYQYEYDAAVSLAYNIGTSAFCASTVVRRFNSGDHQGACDAFLMWNKFQGKELRGLTLRRQRERELCLGRAP